MSIYIYSFLISACWYSLRVRPLWLRRMTSLTVGKFLLNFVTARIRIDNAHSVEISFWGKHIIIVDVHSIRG